MATIARASSERAETRIGAPLAVAPCPRTAEKSSGRMGSKTTPTSTPSRLSSAMLTAQAGKP